MTQFRPFLSVETRGQIVIDHKGNRIWKDYVDKTYPTYRELLKDLPNYYSQAKDGIVRVYRSKRGEWGEWFEWWKDGKIVKEGWM